MFRLNFLVLTVLVFVIVGNAQNKSIFCGTVVDETTAVIPKAVIKAKSNKGKTIKATTDEDGNFEIEIPDGLYKFTFFLSGFKKSVLKNQLIPYQPRHCRTITLKSAVKPHQVT